MWKWDNTLYNTFMTHFTLHFYKSGHVHFNTVLLVLKLTPLIVNLVLIQNVPSLNVSSLNVPSLNVP